MASKTVGWQPESAEAWYRATRTTWPQVFVSDPEEMSEPAMLGLSSTTFTTYLVTTRGVVSGEESGAGGEETTVGVRRRFSDFVVLRDSLRGRYACVALPLLPPGRLTGHTADLSRFRAARLERFLRAVFEDPVLGRDALLRMFATCPFWDGVRKAAEASGQDLERVAARMDATADFPCVSETMWAELLRAEAAGNTTTKGGAAGLRGEAATVVAPGDVARAYRSTNGVAPVG